MKIGKSMFPGDDGTFFMIMSRRWMGEGREKRLEWRQKGKRREEEVNGPIADN